ncbi:MAG TPA: hypothetical protein VLC74_14070 [Rhizomicrobium sp.]|nr:hypothetical protein [Rhizomicrobium sp.]
MKTRSLLPCLLVYFGLVAAAVAAPGASSLPPNDINCKDWTHNPDGSWSSGPNTPGMSDDRLFPGVHVMVKTTGGSSYDVLDVLEKKCAGKPSKGR